MAIDWIEMKNQYEIMHTSVKDLALRHHVSESMILLAAKEGDWQRVDADAAAPDDLSKRLEMMQNRNLAALVPKFISLQDKLLQKCATLLDGAESLSDAKDLKMISDIIEVHRPAIMAVAKDGGGRDTGLNIRIMTTAGTGAQPNVAAVEITQSAGTSNGVGAVSIN